MRNPFVVTDKYDNWVEYRAQSEAVAAFLVCAARKHDCDPELMEQEYLDSHLSEIPKWANGKWERLGRSEIKTAIDLVRKPQQAPAQEQPAAPFAASQTPADTQEDVKASSLLVFRTVEESALAISGGFNSLAASEFKPPLDPAYNRVILFGSSSDDLFRNVSAGVSGMGAIYAQLPRDDSKPKTAYDGRTIGTIAEHLTDVPAEEAHDYLSKLLMTRAIQNATVKRVKMVHAEVPAGSRIEVGENHVDAEQVEAENALVIPQSALSSTYLGDIYTNLFEPAGFPLDIALPALVTAASVLVPALPPPDLSKDSHLIGGDDLMTNLYTALVSKFGGGKSQAIEWAVKVLDIWSSRSDKTEHYMEGKFGSAEQMLKHLKRYLGRPLNGSILINPDEWSHLFAKAAIPDASFPSVLTSGYYRRRQTFEISRGGEITLNNALSFIGGIVDTEFDSVFGANSLGGLYDRFLFGLAPADWKFNYREFPWELKERIPAPAPMCVTRHGSLYEVIKDWNRKDPSLDRIVEICTRIATIYASMDGRHVIGGADLEPLWGLATSQKAIRALYHPNAGMNPDAIFANAAVNWLTACTKGEWATFSRLKEGTHAYEKKLGPSVAERSLKALARTSDAIEVWIPEKVMSEDGKRKVDNDLPADYTGRRPKHGLIRLLKRR